MDEDKQSIIDALTFYNVWGSVTDADLEDYIKQIAAIENPDDLEPWDRLLDSLFDH